MSSNTPTQEKQIVKGQLQNFYSGKVREEKTKTEQNKRKKNKPGFKAVGKAKRQK